MNVRYLVELTVDERAELTKLVSGGKHPVRRVKRAQILLAADAGQCDEAIATSVGAGTSTVFRTKRRFVEGNLELALAEEPRAGAQRKLSGREEALLVATACSNAPEGCARWTLDLLAAQMVKLTEHEEISRETVRRRLAENDLKPWQKKMWCIPKVDAEFVARMEDVLDLYAQTPDPNRPVISFDESPTQLIGEVRVPIPAQPRTPAEVEPKITATKPIEPMPAEPSSHAGKLERYDSEYQRNGTANLFVFLNVHESWRRVKVTDHRTSQDFAQCMRDLVDVYYPSAELIRVVMDNLSTHKPAALYETFPPEEARRILRRLEFHYTPKHASWLNMVEIEIGVLRTQCLDRRIGERELLESEIKAWELRRNASGARINWMFDVEKARTKMGGAYPSPALAPSGPETEQRQAA